jgi:membrane peptidoglycan carboxypeptidase
MSAFSRAASVIGAAIGSIMLSVLAGVLIAAMLTPAITVASTTVETTVGIFDSLPTEVEIKPQPQQNRIFASQDGTDVQIATIFSQNREEVTWDEVSDFAKDAAVSGEDRRYFEHGGIDLPGIARAAVKNVAGGGVSEGASTIAQQYIKNTFIQAALELPTEQERDDAYDAAIKTSLERKLKEIKLAIALDKKYSKQDILLAYLNIANFGGTTYGIEAAAKRYYNTTAKDLTAAQAASLVGIVQSPGVLNLQNPEHYVANQERRDIILGAMLTEDKITREQYNEAIATPVDATTVVLTEPSNGCLVANDHARFFCDYVQKLIKTIPSLGATPEEREANFKLGGYDIYTTLNMNLQINAQDVSWQFADKNATALQLGSATASVEAGSGRILVMAQNKDYNNTEAGGGASATAVNFNTDREFGGSSGFQPGSTYKVFTLIEWLKQGHGINEVVNGSPRTESQSSFTNSCTGNPSGAPFKFRNDDSMSGPMTAATGTQYSVNGAFVSMALQLDLCKIAETAGSLGVHRADGNPLSDTPATVLGTNEVAPLSMAASYAAIGAHGLYCKPIAIDRIVNAAGAEIGGQARECTQAITPEVANTAAFAMSKVMTAGTGRASNPNNGVEYIGKTGTTDSSAATWMVGATTRVGTAVWVGNIVDKVALRKVTINGINASVLRHRIFKATVSAIDNIPVYRGSNFPGPDAGLLTGTGEPLMDVTGKSVEEATTLLEGAGHKVTVGSAVDSNLETSKVASTSPAAGSIVSDGVQVTIQPSNAQLGAIPDVVGNGTTPTAAAREYLVSQGFTGYGADYCVPAAPAQVGMAVSMNPAPGSAVRKADPISLGIGTLAC